MNTFVITAVRDDGYVIRRHANLEGLQWKLKQWMANPRMVTIIVNKAGEVGEEQ